ncbi:unnamed protein product [Caenorhabditis sp. 36 PRJEB53466]|nr:unnamed protein product [Caenorhabditis sp. 36 PRJEB53466]
MRRCRNACFFLCFVYLFLSFLTNEENQNNEGPEFEPAKILKLNTAELLEVINGARRKLASEKWIGNMYKLEWDSDLVISATKRANCNVKVKHGKDFRERIWFPNDFKRLSDTSEFDNVLNGTNDYDLRWFELLWPSRRRIGCVSVDCFNPMYCHIGPGNKWSRREIIRGPPGSAYIPSSLPSPMLLFALLALVPFANSVYVHLSSFGQFETLYKVTKNSKIFVISDSPQEALQNLTLSTTVAGQNSNGFTLSVPAADGSLTPLVSSNDNDYLSVVFSGSSTLSGYLYTSNATSDLRVFPLNENSSVSFQPGTNVFFRMDTPAGKIPVAQNVVVGSKVAFAGFTGIPEDSASVQFFDSASIEGVTNYDQIELPLSVFHFTSNGDNVKYEIKYAARNGLQIGSSGLLMTDDFPSASFGTNDYALVNPDNADIDLVFVPRMNKTETYSGNVTLFYSALPSVNFPMLSTSSANITSISPVNRVVVESEGPYAIQYMLRDTSLTTPAPIETTTKASSIPQIVASLLIVALFLV